MELAKTRFSESKTVNISCTIEDVTHDATVTYDEYERASQDLLNRLRIPIKSAMSDASLKLSDIDSIILVGCAYLEIGNPSEAKKCFERAEELVKTDLNWLLS